MVRKNAELARKDSETIEDSTVVAIDKDKGSQYALKWAVDNFLNRGQSVTLLHIALKASPPHSQSGGGSFPGSADGNEEITRTYSKNLESEVRDLFLPFRCFCTRKDIKCHEIVIEDVDIPKAILEYVSTHLIENLILGTPTRGGIIARKFKSTDVPSTVSKSAPEFCNVYIINKAKVSSQRSATAQIPARHSPPNSSPQIMLQHRPSNLAPADTPHGNRHTRISTASERSPYHTYPKSSNEETEMIKSPFTRGRSSLNKYEPYTPEMDISFVSSGRSNSTDRIFSPFNDNSDPGTPPRRTSSTEYDYRSFGSVHSAGTSTDLGSHYSGSSQESGQTTWYSNNMDDVESEMRRLRLELKQTMDMYSSACKEALSAKQKTREYQRWKLEEQHRFDEARIAEEAALALIEKEKAKCKAAIEAAQAAQKLAELEAQKRMSLETKSSMESEETKKGKESRVPSDIRYRRYTIEEIEAATNDFSDQLKIGEGGYGPVYKCYLDHTEVAVKVLRADAAQGMSQFHQEVEVLSCIRHPNMVLLLGACPEHGCLVYEHMSNGSLDDRLFRRGNTLPLPWQMRFRIAAEIATGLLFLHQTKPEPLVHRDLKPGNILLDRNFVSKISDVGLARLVPPSVADSVTQYRMTSTAGTFCYIDPEYQQTGMLGTKSDIYSFGVLLLQIITAKSPMGLAHQVESAIDAGSFAEILDPTIPDWPIQETLSFAKLALQCAELRKKDRPDLGKVILPQLSRWRAFGEQNTPYPMFGGIFCTTSSPNHSHISSLQEAAMTDIPSASDCSSLSSSSSYGGRR
ncbi:U-box domain-containing protein 35 isoform X2 [Ricinus communis]|uniref:U-box domain-containing protein 35 isoform X2 n=1 Tax=Ricinus communis TaxID=3988 RepID=UPI00077220E2|nr:U-box domain-containing protein 35 isoform X2 [Ricinus communis]|eukprot:XP_015575800.1 U-box domain-containing protein 35 isoform X2 [Ricinus communis]